MLQGPPFSLRSLGLLVNERVSGKGVCLRKFSTLSHPVGNTTMEIQISFFFFWVLNQHLLLRVLSDRSRICLNPNPPCETKLSCLVKRYKEDTDGKREPELKTFYPPPVFLFISILLSPFNFFFYSFKNVRI